MIKPKQDHQSSGNQESKAPSSYGTAKHFLEQAYKYKQTALSGNHGYAVSGIPDTHKHGLLAFVKAKHVESVNGYVVRGRTERHEP